MIQERNRTRLYELSQKIDLLGFGGISEKELSEFWELTKGMKKKLINDDIHTADTASFYKAYRTSMEQTLKEADYMNMGRLLDQEAEYKERTGTDLKETLKDQINEITHIIQDAEKGMDFIKAVLETEEIETEKLKLELEARQAFLYRLNHEGEIS